MFDNVLAQQGLRTVQFALPVVLFALLLSAFLPSSRPNAVGSRDGANDLPGVVPVILAVSRPRVTLVVTVLALLSSTYGISLVLLLVFQHGHPPAISLWTAGSGVIIWSTTTALLYETRARAAARGATWTKAMLWIGLIGEGAMGALRVYIFVQSTSTLPQTAFPLPFFLHFALVSARLLHFILALWAISNPRREFVPAAGRRPSEAAAGRNGDDEREGLLAGAEEAAVGGEGPGYGTFAEGEQAEGSTSTPQGFKSRSVASTKSLKSRASSASGPSVDAEARAVAVGTDDGGPQPASYAEVVKHDASAADDVTTTAQEDTPAADGLEVPISSTSNILDLTISSADTPTKPTSKASTPPTPASPVTSSIPLPLTTSTMPTPVASPPPARSAELAPAAEPAPPSSSAVPFPSSSVSSHASASTDHTRPQRSTTPETADKRKRMTSLSDMGRKMSDEGKTFVRKMSLLKRGKSSSGTSSPIHGSGSTERLDGASPPVLDPTTSPRPDSFSSPTLQKRFSLLSRKSSSHSAPSSPTPEQQPLAGAADSSERKTGGGGGGGGKKGKGGGQKGRNGKGKKVSKYPKESGKRSPH